MCSGGCGGTSSALPGATTKSAIVLGNPDGRAAQPAVFQVDHKGIAKKGDPKFVTGTGVEQAVADGIITVGLRKPAVTPRRGPAITRGGTVLPYQVSIGTKKWVGFTTRAAAERYARTRGVEVQSKDDVIAEMNGAVD